MVQPFSDAAPHDADLAHEVVRREDAVLRVLAGLACVVVLSVVDVVARGAGVLGRRSRRCRGQRGLLLRRSPRRGLN
eukprot:2534293-Heterocapsa_arctica.AAC.1